MIRFLNLLISFCRPAGLPVHVARDLVDVYTNLRPWGPRKLMVLQMDLREGPGDPETSRFVHKFAKGPTGPRNLIDLHINLQEGLQWSPTPHRPLHKFAGVSRGALRLRRPAHKFERGPMGPRNINDLCEKLQKKPHRPAHKFAGGSKGHRNRVDLYIDLQNGPRDTEASSTCA